MGKIEDSVRATITRSVANELRRVLTPVTHDVQELKRTLAELQKAVSSVQERGVTVVAQPKAEAVPAVGGKKEAKASAFSPAQIGSLRTCLGMTQGQMAAALGMSQATVQKWESGDRKPMASGRAALKALQERGRPKVARSLPTKKAPAAKTRAARKAPRATRRW